MKNFIIIFLFSCTAYTGYAQGSQSGAPSGSWVVESNINSPRKQVVKFYNSNNKLIYEEVVSNKKIRIEKEKVRRVLNLTLLTALKNYSELQPGTLSARLRNKKSL